MKQAAKRPDGKSARPFRKNVWSFLANPLPGLTAAEHAAEGAALHPHRIRSLHRDRRVVVPVTVRIVNPPRPSAVRTLDVEQDFLASLLGIAAQLRSARLAPTFPLFSSVAHTPTG